MKKLLFFTLLVVVMSSCRISYSFRSTSIDYTINPTISIDHFINQSPLVFSPLEQRFNEAVQDMFTRNTRLQIIPNNASMELEGEIVGYTLTPLAVADDAFAAETRLTMSVRFRFRNNATEEPEQQQTISANRVFPASVMLDQVQDQLVEELIREIVDQIFNATMTSW